MKFKKSIIIRSIFIFVLFISSFAGTSLPNSNITAPLFRTSTVKILKQLGGVPCPNDSSFTCVTLDVPLDHFNPADTRKIPVTFAVLPAAGSRKGMFVVATGGPGTSGIALADSYTSGYKQSILNRFDIVFFDQRGVGLSGGLACPQAAVEYYRSDTRTETDVQKASLSQSAQTFSENCIAETGNAEIIPYLGTAQAIEDLEYFRQVMQDTKFWLYGESYGTQYAQTYAAKYGKQLAGLILDGTVDLTLNGFDYYAQQAQAFSDTLTATLDACTNDPYCIEDVGGNILKRYPDLTGISDNVAEAYDHAVKLLGNYPDTIDFPLPQGGFETRNFTLADLEVVAAGQLYTESDRMMLNRALAASASYDNLVPLARLLYISLGLDPQTLEIIPDSSYSDAIFYAVECQDYGYPGSTFDERTSNFFAAGDQVVPLIPRLGSLFYGDIPCAYWPNATTDLSRPAPLIADGIPTLVLNATADPATPIGNARSVYSRLKNGYLITQEGGPHVIFGWGNACPDNIVTQFLVNNRMPAKRETICPGITVDDYVPISPTDASGFVNLLDALGWTETEMSYLPEYYYWDGYTPSQVGCPLGGTFAFDTDAVKYLYTFDACSFANDFTFTGTGSYNPNRDQFILTITTEGRWQCNIKYTRTGARTSVTGNCNGNTIRSQGKSLTPVQSKTFIPHIVPGKSK